MTPELDTLSPSKPSAAARREAAVWIARIHSPDRKPAVEEGLRRWLEANPENRAAFELANEMWDVAARVPEEAVPRVMRWRSSRPGRTFPLRWVTAAVVIPLIALAAFLAWPRASAVATGIGEQRSLTLPDGTRISLNTATRIEVSFTDRQRRVQLLAGEALFDVAGDAARPFIVTAGDRQIRVLGTSFVVRYEPMRTAITVVSGKVSVEQRAAESSALTLTPGQRIVLAARIPPTLDRPAVDKVTAWQRGLVALDHTPLADAVAEMNRYSKVQLEVGTAEAAQARISGVFRAGDSVFFAQAIARTYRLKMSQNNGRIVLSGVPAATF